jgi:hypothetical protein
MILVAAAITALQQKGTPIYGWGVVCDVTEGARILNVLEWEQADYDKVQFCGGVCFDFVSVQGTIRRVQRLHDLVVKDSKFYGYVDALSKDGNFQIQLLGFESSGHPQRLRIPPQR